MSTARTVFLFLHGWSGDSTFWNPLRKALGDEIFSLAPDLPGHNSTPGLKKLGIRNLEEMANWIADWTREHTSAKDTLILSGYSMGGRISTLVPALLSDRNVRGLALFSSGLGVQGGELRRKRLMQEKAWARELLEAPEKFWRKWYGQELFQGDSPVELENRISSKKRHNSSDLADAMELLSPASHEDLRESLHAMKHLLYFVGELDKKYCEIAQEVRNIQPAARVEIVPEADHMVPVRQPKYCAEILKNWLKEIGAYGNET